MSGHCLRACAWAAGLVLVAGSARAGAHSVEIAVAFDQVFDRVQPTERVSVTHYDMHVVLDTSGAIAHSERKSDNGRAIFAIDKKLRLGQKAKLEWAVVDAHSLRNTYHYKTFHRDLTVAIDGAQCSVTIAYALDEGASDYRYRSQPSGVPAVARAVRAQNARCAVVGQGSA